MCKTTNSSNNLTNSMNMDEIIEQNRIAEIFRFDNLERFKSNYSLTDSFMLNDDRFAAFGEIFKNKPSLLCIAAYYNAIKIGEYLFQNGASPTTGDAFFRSPIHFAGAGGSLAFIRLLESHNADINAYDNRQRTYIHYAAEYDRVEILKYAYISGANLDEKSVDGCPIHLACKTGSFLSIEFLTKTKQCDLNRSVRDRPPILHLLNASCFEAIPLLLHYGMNIDNLIVGNWTTLYYVIRTGSSHVVQMLLDFGADPNGCCGRKGWAPMHVAAQEHNMKIVDILYNKGGIIHCLTESRQSPFSLALSPSQFEKGDLQYQTAKRIKTYEVDFFARSLILTLALKKLHPRFDEVVAQSVKKSEAEKASKRYQQPFDFNL